MPDAGIVASWRVGSPQPWPHRSPSRRFQRRPPHGSTKSTPDWSAKIRGPITVVVTGNPFRYAWSVTVNQTVVSAPGIDKALVASGNATALPVPTVGPQTVGGTPPPSPPPGQFVINVLANPAGAPDAPGQCADQNRFDRLERCIRELAAQIEHTVKDDVLASWGSVCTAQLEFLALQARSDVVIESLHFGTPVDRVHARQVLSSLLGGKPDDEPSSPSCAAANRVNPTSPPPARRYRYATVASANAAINRIRPFPKDAIGSEQTALNSLQGSLKAYDAGKINIEAATDADQHFLECANPLIKQSNPKAAITAKPPLGEDGRKAAFETFKAAVNNNAAVIKKCEDPVARETQIAENPGLNGAHRFAVADAELKGLATQLTAYAPTASYPMAIGNAISQLTMLQGLVLANVGVSRFFVEIPEECNGLYGNTRTTTITVQRYATEHNSVVIDCPPRVFTSGGFAFGWQAQRFYTPAPINSALPQAPPGSPTPPPATIQQLTTFDARPVPVVLLNVRFTPAEGPIDNDFYLSVGVSLGSVGGTTTANTALSGLTIPLDFLAGVSYSLSRQLLVTGGMMLGPETSIAPGYNIGDPIPLNGTIPTVTRTRAKPFLAITYAPH